jgi:hypothetical protein
MSSIFATNAKAAGHCLVIYKKKRRRDKKCRTIAIMEELIINAKKKVRLPW